MDKIILASGSPRRQELLRNLGLNFEIIVPIVEERPPAEDTPNIYAQNLAYRKAKQVLPAAEGALVIVADTIVVKDGIIMGKPQDRNQARNMLLRLSGSKHTVITGLCVVNQQHEIITSESSDVYFRDLNEREIERYIDSGEPFDKAGGYGIQGLGALFVSRIEGCYYNVVGLPLAKLQIILGQLGISLI